MDETTDKLVRLSAAPAGGGQLGGLSRDELAAVAEGYGIDPRRHRTRQALVAAIHDRRQTIASIDRDALLDVVRWGRRPVAASAGRDELAREAARCRSMRFGGLSRRGLVALARLRGARVDGTEDDATLVRRLKAAEPLRDKLARKRRNLIGHVVDAIAGGEEPDDEHRFLPPAGAATRDAPHAPHAAPDPPPDPPRRRKLRHRIEDRGLLGGLADQVRQTADGYVNQKLDEIEGRIDRKLDEIDRRLAEWRDKEVANRIRILKITLWASLIVALLSLAYSYLRAHGIGG